MHTLPSFLNLQCLGCHRYPEDIWVFIVSKSQFIITGSSYLSYLFTADGPLGLNPGAGLAISSEFDNPGLRASSGFLLQTESKRQLQVSYRGNRPRELILLAVRFSSTNWVSLYLLPSCCTWASWFISSFTAAVKARRRADSFAKVFFLRHRTHWSIINHLSCWNRSKYPSWILEIM